MRFRRPWGGGVNVRRAPDARDPGYSTTGWRAGLSFWRDVGRLTLTAGGEVGRLKADERLSLFPSKREDRYSACRWPRRSGRCSSAASRLWRSSPSSGTPARLPFTIITAAGPRWASPAPFDHNVSTPKDLLEGVAIARFNVSEDELMAGPGRKRTFRSYCFSRYPVRNIQAMTAMQTTIIATVTSALDQTGTSATE